MWVLHLFHLHSLRVTPGFRIKEKKKLLSPNTQCAGILFSRFVIPWRNSAFYIHQDSKTKRLSFKRMGCIGMASCLVDNSFLIKLWDAFFFFNCIHRNVIFSHAICLYGWHWQVLFESYLLLFPRSILLQDSYFRALRLLFISFTMWQVAWIIVMSFGRLGGGPRHIADRDFVVVLG